jgi:predicted Mrr-cat superfamily restriction endonuclease
MNFWIHRISYNVELSYPLLEKGFLSIGFSDFTNEDIIDKAKALDWNYFNGKFKEKWKTIPRTRHNLWNFLRMSKGDIVIVPSSGSFSICEIVGETPTKIGEAFSEDLKTWNNNKVKRKGNFLSSEDDKTFDLGFAWKVKVLHKNISRDKFADAKLTSRMKIRQTTTKINDLKTSVENSVKIFSINKPIHLHSIIIDKTAKLVLEAIKSELNPDKFEKLVKAYFSTVGANSVSIPAKNERDKEGDADIVAVFENIKLIIYIQVKFHKGKVNEWGANQILDYKTNKESIDDGYNKIAWVISSADSFSIEAQNIATENEIQLVNGLEFSKMLLNAGINSLNTFL